MERKRTSRKKIAALLAAACVAGNMPYAQVRAYAEETVPSEENGAESSRQEDEVTGGTADGTADGENADGTADGNLNDTDAADEDGADGPGDEKNAGSEEGTEADDISGEETETEAEDGVQSDMTDSSETGGTADSGTYTDENGVSYFYNICEDGTADIYDIKNYAGKNVDIPAEAGGCTVTSLTCRVPYGRLESLTIPETVTYVNRSAFTNLEIGTLRYNAVSASTGDNTAPAPFSSSKIGNFLIGENVEAIPKRMFSNAVFQQDEVVIHTQTVCEDAFWSAEFQKLTIGEEVRDIGIHAFSFSKVGELCWNAADIETYGEAGVGRNAPFTYASVHGISFGDAAVSIPAGFVNGVTDLSVSRLEIPSTITSVGSRAFYNPYEGSYTIGSLYIGKNMSYLGDSAFDGCDIGILEYNAADAATDGPDGNGPFDGSRAGELCIGEDVTVLPAKIFCGMALEQEELEISGSIVSVEDKALCSGSGNEIRIGTLTVGEQVSHMGMYALAAGSIGTLNYNAENAGTNGDHGTPDSPFYNTTVGKLQIGAGVRKIPASAFAGIGLEQDSLEFPAGVSSIGAKAFQQSSWRGISIGTVVIGENISDIGRGAFASCAIGKAHVCTLESEWASGDIEFPAYETPACTSVEIHGGSDYYSYFTSKSNPENITLLCSDFENSHGEEYFDAEKGCFVTPVTETCTACGYQKLGGEYADAHTVIFMDHDGTEISRQAVRDGGDAEPPEDPVRTGWRFTGWDKEYKGITADLTVTAQYEICRFTVTFMDGEKVLSSQEVEYGSDAEIPEDPTRPDEAWGRWQFAGWDGSYAGITKDVTVRALFEKVLNEYEAVFYDADGNVLSRQTIKHGGKAEAPQAPEKAADSQYIYVFKGWDADTENITSDSSFHPVYETRDQAGVTSPGAFTVTFMDEEKVLSVQKVESGKDASAPEDPTRPDEAWGKWQFTGWNGSYQNITKDETVYALFEKVLNEYEVIFNDEDGNILSTQTVKHGEKAKTPQAPEKPADGKYTYVFKGWNADTENITADIHFYPVYEKKEQESGSTDADTYTVTFMDGDKVLAVQKVESGRDASAPADPARPDEAWGKWQFTGWKGSYQNVTKNETVYAMFEKVLNEYKVIFYDADGNVLSTQTVKHGEKAKAPQAPQKAADGKYTYIFKGWDADTENITADTSFHPVYETKDSSSASDNASTYTVTFMDGDKVLAVQKVESGKDASVPADPARPDETWGKWKFTGWKGSYKNITKDETVYAMFEKVLNEYKVIFYDADGNILSTQTVKHGEKAKTPQAPKKAADGKYTYVFKGWDADTENITSDTSFHPVYEAKTSSGTSDNASTYTVTFMDGDKVLAVQKVKAGRDASVPANPARPDEAWGKWQFAGWDGSYKNITKNETVYAMFERVLNEYKVVFYGADGEILSTQTIKHGEKAKVPQGPKKAPDARHKYIFAGWDGNTENITSDTSLHPVYETRTRTYTVTFMGGKKTLSVQEVEYGAGAAAPSDPVKKADGKHTYKFAGWDADFSFITKDMTVHALFDVEENGADGQNQSKDKNKDKDTNKDKDKNKDKDTNKNKDTDQDKNTGKDKNTDKNKGAGNGGSGADGEDTKTGSGGTGRPAGGITGSGRPGKGQPETGGKKTVTGNTPSVQKPDAEPESRPADGEKQKQSQQIGKGTDGNKKQEKTDEEKGQEKEEDTKVTDESGTDSPETADEEDSRTDGGKSWKHAGGFMPLFFLITGAASAIAVWALLYFRFFRKRRIRGTVVDTDGNPVCGIPVSIAGEDTFETCTDRQGSFCFDGLEKGVWKLEVSRGGKTRLSMEICAGSRDKEETFRICSSHCLRVDHMQEKNDYVIDVTLL